ncbi:MAG: DUF554 domain-containing protein [Desulfovibrionaceae bacterium]|nr:DUF554 domain-containing protein [Desulfovibrionaceae bacterium]
MLIPVGSLVNAGAIMAGGTLGLFLGRRLTSGLQSIAFHGLGLCLVVIALQMALQMERPLQLLFSILLGGILGEICDLDRLFNLGGDKLKRTLRSGDSRFTEGFVSATALFGIGSMVILGPLDEGLTGDHTILFTKSILDFCFAIALSAAFGIGVIFSAFPILLVEGLITIMAGSLQSMLTTPVILDIKVTGGVIILAIALNILELARIKLANLLPALPAAAFLAHWTAG